MTQAAESETGTAIALNGSNPAPAPRRSVLFAVAERYQMDPQAFEATLRGTVVPKETTREEFAAFLLVANEYNLNPLTREIFAFPKKGGGISTVVSIDGWLKLLNGHPHYDGMDFEDITDGSKLIAVKCRIHHKHRSHPIEVTEYLTECDRATEPWKKWPARMLRHKATIQGARYSFGFAGIIDPDEAERMAPEAPRLTPPPPPTAAYRPAAAPQAQEMIPITQDGEIIEPGAPLKATRKPPARTDDEATANEIIAALQAAGSTDHVDEIWGQRDREIEALAEPQQKRVAAAYDAAQERVAGNA